MLFSAHAHRLWKRRQFLICLLGRDRERRLWCSSSRSVGGSLSGSGLLEKKISYKTLFYWFEVMYSTFCAREYYSSISDAEFFTRYLSPSLYTLSLFLPSFFALLSASSLLCRINTCALCCAHRPKFNDTTKYTAAHSSSFTII